MVTQAYVDQILYSPVYLFNEIVDTIIGQNIHYAKLELKRYPIELDTVLVASIKSILEDLQKEEGAISRFLYAHFGVEIRKNKRRKQLIYLGSELKTQHNKMKSKLYGLKQQKESLLYCLVDLRRLSESIRVKDILFESDNIKNKSKFYLDELEVKIDALQKLEEALSMRYHNQIEVESIYQKLLSSIPRYEILQEETHLLLIAEAKA